MTAGLITLWYRQDYPLANMRQS